MSLLSFILFSITILNNILKIDSSGNNADIASIKFKTFYPLSYNMAFNHSKYEVGDYMDSYHFSKIYLELETGDINENTNQTLNVLIDLKDIIFSTIYFYFEQYNSQNINLLCHFNCSKSTTLQMSQYYFSYNNIKSLSCESTDYFKIYNDLSLTNYSMTNLKFVNTEEHEKHTTCGNIGLANLNTKYIEFNFISQLYKKLNLSEMTYFFNYSISDEEGLFIVGNMPHNYLPNKYNIEELIPIYSSNSKVYFDEMIIEGYKMEDMDEQFQVLFTPDIEGLEFPDEYFDHIKLFYFKEYIDKGICYNVSYKKQYEVIYCDNNTEINDTKLSQKIIDEFPKIYFNKNKNYFSVFFTGKDLFYSKDNKLFFKIVKNKEREYFLFGRIFFKKFISVFNLDKKQIYFYNNNLKGKDKDDNYNTPINLNIIVVIVSVLLAIMFFPLGVYFGKKLFEKRSKLANELKDDDYQYQPENLEKNMLSPSL